MRAWPVARSIFDAPCGRSERAENRLDSPNQVLTHAARTAAKQLNNPFQPPLMAARGGLWLEQENGLCSSLVQKSLQRLFLVHFQQV